MGNFEGGGEGGGEQQTPREIRRQELVTEYYDNLSPENAEASQNDLVKAQSIFDEAGAYAEIKLAEEEAAAKTPDIEA